MKEILTADQMRRSDQRMIQKMQIPSLVLMERAALQCVAAMKAEDIDLSKALVVCGSGNNGGDGFAIARMLVEEGNHPDVVLVGNYDHRSEETKIQMKILGNLGISVGNSLPQKEYSVKFSPIRFIVSSHYFLIFFFFRKCIIKFFIF